MKLCGPSLGYLVHSNVSLSQCSINSRYHKLASRGIIINKRKSLNNKKIWNKMIEGVILGKYEPKEQ